ncbi:uncharacterized protein LOC131952704 [Physella acuta]|uniref:uncharacterized protein LOC131952704 n=1 Tax=Physella acuta TaxID=109671 RepID=UPI0027DC5A3D|nr:uncharacterized protein LOC131952704 [Physella acuta]XP_059171462.1 uncharacterized protein LOC131952704 [Physella acuta]
MIKNRALTLGFLSGFVIAGGIVFAVLLAKLLDKLIIEDSSDWRNSDWNGSYETIASFPIWAFGFVLIVPGFFGFIAAFVQNKCMYVTTLVFGIVCFIGLGVIILILGLGMYAIVITKQVFQSICQSTENTCVCSGDGGASITYGESCEYFDQLRDMFIGMFVAVVISWVVLFIQFIFCCYYSCCAKDTSTPYVSMQTDHMGLSVTQVSQQSSQSSVNPLYMMPVLVAPQYGQVVYGAPQPSQAGYGAPQYGQVGYGAPQPSQAGFVAMQSVQSSFGAAQSGKAGFDNPQYCQAGFGAL